MYSIVKCINEYAVDYDFDIGGEIKKCQVIHITLDNKYCS